MAKTKVSRTMKDAPAANKQKRRAVGNNYIQGDTEAIAAKPLALGAGGAH